MKTLAITSGKGGVGKTNLSANLAVALSQLGQRVVVLDGDIGLANLDVVLGCKSTATLQDVISGDKSLLEVVQNGPAGIRYIAGGSGIETIFHLTPAQSRRFSDDLVTLASNADILLLDTGAGLDSNVLGFLDAADQILVIVTPDPASITDGYATIKAIFKLDLSADVSMIVNQVHGKDEALQLYQHISGISQKFLNRSLDFAGYVRHDQQAVQYIRNRKPFVLGDPNLAASQDVIRIAHEIVGIPSSIPATSGKDFRSLITSFFGRTKRIA